MSRNGSPDGRYAYKLLATSRTSTMQKELQDASDQGFHYRDQTVFKSTFGGTLQKELAEVGSQGYEVVGMAVGKTAIGGKEIIAITRRARRQ